MMLQVDFFLKFVWMKTDHPICIVITGILIYIFLDSVLLNLSLKASGIDKAT